MDFFSTIRKKLQQKPDRNFDQRFWNRFDSEFTPRKSFWAGRLIPMGLPVALILCLGLALVTRSHRPVSTELQVATGATEGLSSVLSEDDIMNEIEFFSEMDESLLGASDEEWEQLLGTETS